MSWTKAEAVAYALLRVVAGSMFFQAGAMKILGWFGGMPDQPGVTASLTTQVGIGGLLEVVGGIAILLGLFTRPVAFVLSGEMAVAYFQFHQPNGTWPVQNGGVSAALYCFLFLFMCAHGGGAYSLDALLARRKAAGGVG
jgi:putative oxidoreductase